MRQRGRFRMKLPRRNFLHLAAGAAALAAVSRIAKAQAYPSRPGAGRLPLVAVLMPYAESDSTAQVWYNAFVRGMQALGWTQGRNFRMDVGWAGGEVDRIQALARKLVDLKPDAIFTVTTPSVNAARDSHHSDRVHAGHRSCRPRHSRELG